ncbi:helix-turn-helix transcriptional regulator [Amycolatopsis sp. NPDC049868]|uniref:helix-turn-helix transcriptional regulator n=1 Tax=Amycolatopsis sp. NPDC049868 TaxID=3363934 RepID=UPI0037922231
MSSLESVTKGLSWGAGHATSMSELGIVLSAQIGRLVPHDGYLLIGFDPVTGASCLMARHHFFTPRTRHRLEVELADAGPGDPLFGMFRRRIHVLGSGFTDERFNTHLHDTMASEGFGSQLCLTLTRRGVPRGGLVLLRERGARPFSGVEAKLATHLAEPLACSLRAFVTAKPPRGALRTTQPGVVIVGDGNRVKAMTPTAETLLRDLLHELAIGDDELPNTLLNIALFARRPGRQAVSRVPASFGWLVLSGQVLDSTPKSDVAITVQAAGADLLSAVSAWYGITPRETTVIERVLEGLPAKHIARGLGLSPYTVNDHLKAIYRKIGVSSREELTATLTHMR